MTRRTAALACSAASGSRPIGTPLVLLQEIEDLRRRSRAGSRAVGGCGRPVSCAPGPRDQPRRAGHGPSSRPQAGTRSPAGLRERAPVRSPFLVGQLRRRSRPSTWWGLCLAWCTRTATGSLGARDPREVAPLLRRIRRPQPLHRIASHRIASHRIALRRGATPTRSDAGLSDSREVDASLARLPPIYVAVFRARQRAAQRRGLGHRVR